MSTKPCLFQQLWTIFSTTIVKNPPNFVKYFSSLFHLLHCHAVFLWIHFYNKSYTYFNIDDKIQLLNNCLLCRRFYEKSKPYKCSFFMVCKIWPRFCNLQKIQICHTDIFIDTPSQTCNFFLETCFHLA